MSYDSPFLNPEQYVTKVRDLSSQGIQIDEAVDRAVRDAREYSSKHSSDFTLLTLLKDSLENFQPRWTEALTISRDVASGLSSRLKRFSEVFLAMIDLVDSQQDAKDVIVEFRSFLGEENPSSTNPMEGTPGPKKAFKEIEGLVDQECNHIVNVMEDSKDWNKAIQELKQKLPQINEGVKKVERAVQDYAVRLEG